MIGHAIEIDQKAEENFVGSWAILVNAAEIAQNGNARNILAMERKHTVGLCAYVAAFCWRRWPVYLIMLTIVGCGNPRQEASNHLYDVCHRHRADLVLPAGLQVSTTQPWSCHVLLTCKALDMGQISYF